MINKYLVIKAIADTSQITKASDKLHMTQSAVSHVLKSIEKEWGFSIFKRLYSGMQLTKEGEHLLNYLSNVIYANERLQQEVKKIKGIDYGHITVGTFPSVTTKWMPTIIQKISSDYPNLQIEIIEDNYETIENEMLNGKIDCGFIGDKPTSDLINSTPLYEEDFVCLVNYNNVSSKQSHFSINEIENYPFILPGVGGDVELSRFFKKNNIKPNIKFEIMDINQSIVAMIKRNIGISILPELILTKLPEEVKALKLNKPFKRNINIIHRSDISPATRVFKDTVLNLFNTNSIPFEYEDI